MKPRVVSKNTQTKVAYLKIQAQSGFDGNSDTKPAAVTAAGGLPIRDVDIIGRVGRTYRFGHVAASGMSAGFAIDLVDGGSFGGGFGTAQKQVTAGGGIISIQGTFVPNKYGKKGKVLGASGWGYVVNATGAFARSAWLSAGTPVTMKLGEDGRTWSIT